MGNVVGVVLVEEVEELVELEEAEMVPFLELEPDGAADPEDDGALVAIRRQGKGRAGQTESSQYISLSDQRAPAAGLT